MLATRINEQRSAVRNCNVALHCVDTGHIFYLAETKILNHSSSWTAPTVKSRFIGNSQMQSYHSRWPAWWKNHQHGFVNQFNIICLLVNKREVPTREKLIFSRWHFHLRFQAFFLRTHVLTRVLLIISQLMSMPQFRL